MKRRFSDFLGLHDRLNGKFLHLGRIVPPAPEKSVVGKLYRQSLEPSGTHGATWRILTKIGLGQH